MWQKSFHSVGLSEILKAVNIAKGSISSAADTKAEAALVRDLWAGAIQRSTIAKSTAPMKEALTFLKKHFRSLETTPDPANTSFA